MPPFRTHSAYAFSALGASISFAFCKATTTAGTRMSCTTMPGIAFKSAPEMNAANVNAPASAAMPLRITFTMPQTILPATLDLCGTYAGVMQRFDVVDEGHIL